MSIHRTCFAVLALLLLWIEVGSAQRSRVSWQQVEAPCIQLGVRDKTGVLGRYDVVFEVSALGHKATARRHVTGDHWGDIYYPNDFDFGNDIQMQRADSYSWKATVAGTVVANGSFHLTSREAKVPY